MKTIHGLPFRLFCFISLALSSELGAQILLNVDFGVGSRSPKVGFAATGQSSNDFWNLYRHYDPKFIPGTALVSKGILHDLKLSDGSDTKASVAVTNAPGVWGNATGDPMYDTYLFSQNGSNITIAVSKLEPGHYHFYLYGHADADVTGEQNSLFTLTSGTNIFGPLTTLGSSGWKASSPWQERYQYVVFRDVPVMPDQPVIIDVAAGPNGVPVLNGMQIISRGTSPPKVLPLVAAKASPTLTNLIFREIRYNGRVTDHEARFSVDLQVESMTTNQISATLFEGDVAVLAPELSEGLRIVSAAKQYRLCASAPGRYHLKLELVAKITKAEPWNQISFLGPNAAIASISAQAATPGVEMQLLSGTQLDPEQKATSKVQGFLGSDRTLALRWQSKTTEVARKSLVTVDTLATAQITPTVIKYTTQLRYEILQAGVSRLAIALPSSHALTRIQGEQIRDWQVQPHEDRQRLTIEFIKPIEKSYALTLFSEQALQTTPLTAEVVPPQPLEVERESGSLVVSADDVLVEMDSAVGLRQVNAAAGILAAYRFYGRPFALAAKINRIEPVIKVADRITARLEETRLLVAHGLTLTVEKAGIYALELTPQTGFVVADVRGEGIEEWKVTGSKLLISFSSRVLGERKLEVQLEQALKAFPDQFTVAPLRAAAAASETAQIGAASTLGIRLKTAGELSGVREISVTSLRQRSDELLAYAAEQGDWTLTLAAERLAARIVADIFNLVTIGDGLVGGSATIRYGLINQGVQEFKVTLPSHWKNVEFTGPNIRRKEQAAPAAGQDTNYMAWTITLQDKAWGGYTLVVTYDYQFDPKKATLDVSGAHPLNAERETGSLAITTAASLKLEPKAASDPLRLIDQTELTPTDRALITRPVLLAYRYTGESYRLAVDVTRHEELPVLDAVADRTQITSVLTEAGEMLTQASFMVKNNDKQFQRFLLPGAAKFWGCYVNGQPVKAETDGNWLLVSLPRRANRDEAFAVDIVYAQKFAALQGRMIPRSIQLAAPNTDVPNTYAEWEIYVPPSQRLSGFGGTMSVLRGTTYGLRDAWQRFVNYYRGIWNDSGGALLFLGVIAILVVALIGQSIRRGWNGAITVLVVFAILAVLAGMLLPSLSKSKARAVQINAMSNLKQIGLATRMFANDNGGRFPVSFEEMQNQLGGNDKILVEPSSGQRFVYVGAGKTESNPQAIIAYSPVDLNGRVVAFADGSVQQMSSAQFAAALQRDGAAATQFASNTAQQQTVLEQQTRTAPATRAGRRTGVTAAQPAAQTPASAPVAPLAQDSVLAGDASVSGGAMVMNYATTNTVVNGAVLGAIDPSTGLRAGGGAGGADRHFRARLGTVVNRPAAEGPGSLSEFAYNPADFNAAVPTAAGVRSIRINIPRTGQPFTFTKVLNVNDEPLTVKMSAMKMKWFQFWRSVFQLAAFLTGLFIVWRQWLSARRNSVWLTSGLALALGAVTHWMIAMRALHLALIAALPIVLLAVIVGLAWKFWPRKAEQASGLFRTATETPGLGPDAPGPGGIPPAVAGLMLLFCLSQPNQAVAEDGGGQSVRRQTPGVHAAASSFSIVSAHYLGTVREKVGQFSATIQVTAFATNQTIPLFDDDVALQEFSADAREVNLLRQGHSVSIRLAEQGSATLKLKFAVKLGGDVSKRRLAFAVPPALSSQLNVTIDEAEADVEFPTAIAFKRTSDKKETQVEAVLGAGDRVEMFWTPRVKRIAEMAASIFVQNTSLVTVGGGVVNTRTVLDYQVTQGELRQVKLHLPPGERLLRVEGELIRTWELSEEGKTQMLTVDLLKGVSPGYRLTVETEKLLDKLPAQVKLEIPTAQDVIRETGLVGVRGTEELSLSIESVQDLQRVDAAEFSKASRAEGVWSAYRFLKPGFQLVARAEAIQAQVEAVVRNAFRVGFEQVTISAQIDYTIKKAGLFTLRLALPENYKLETVTGASNILQWVEKSEPHVLEVALKERTMGAFTLRIGLAKAHKELPRTIDLSGVQPLGTQKLTGFLSVSSESGLAVKTTTFEGLTEIPASMLGENIRGASGASSVLAYKFIATEPPPIVPWKLTVVTETVESWVRAEIVSILSVSETLVNVRALVRYDIQNAPAKEFRLKVPTAYKNVEFYGPDIRRRDRNNDEWRIELQNKVRGSYLLTVTWEQSRDPKTNAPIDVAGIEALGVEREVGSVVMMARPPLQVTERSATEQLIRIDVGELPEWAGISASAALPGAEVPVLAYRYLRPGYKLALEARRFTDADVLQALVDNARLTTVVADDGQMMTEMVLALRNNGKQHLEIALPPRTKVWSAFVAGQPVRPSQNAGRLMLPIERSIADDAPITVELTYVSMERFPKQKGEVMLASPKLDVPLKNARWDLYLPPDYDYSKFGGSMSHDSDAAPTVRVYSSQEYLEQEKGKRAARLSEMKGYLSKARSELASGNVKAVNEDYNRLNTYADEETKRELVELKKDLGKAQSSNLIQAQRAYTAENAARFNGSGPQAGVDIAGVNQPPRPAQQAAEMLQYDADVAEQQWGALQRAQEVTVAKAQPLRANLPMRGLHHSFSQVLQTEVSKSMVIQFTARNVKEVGWFKTLVYGISGFLMLWIFVAVMVNRPARRPEPASA